MKKLKRAVIRYNANKNDVVFNLEKAQEVLIGILGDFQRFCDDNGIRFSVTYGSLLGAIREKSIIKWDDDIDVMMTEENFNKAIDNVDKLPSYNLSFYHYSVASKIPTNEIRLCREGYYRVLENNGSKYLCPLCIDVFLFSKISVASDEKATKKQSKILKKIKRKKSILMLKELKYNSKNRLRSIFRGFIKFFLVFISEERLHIDIDKSISVLYKPNTDYMLFSPYAGGRFWLKFEKHLLDNTIKVPFGDINVSAISSYDGFLTSVYGDWRTPYDRSGGTAQKTFFIERHDKDF